MNYEDLQKKKNIKQKCKCQGPQVQYVNDVNTDMKMCYVWCHYGCVRVEKLASHQLNFITYILLHCISPNDISCY